MIRYGNLKLNILPRGWDVSYFLEFWAEGEDQVITIYENEDYTSMMGRADNMFWGWEDLR